MATSIEEQIRCNTRDLLKKFPDARKISKCKYIIELGECAIVWDSYPSQKAGNNKFKIYNEDFKALVHEIIAELRMHRFAEKSVRNEFEEVHEKGVGCRCCLLAPFRVELNVFFDPRGLVELNNSMYFAAHHSQLDI